MCNSKERDERERPASERSAAPKVESVVTEDNTDQIQRDMNRLAENFRIQQESSTRSGIGGDSFAFND